MKLRSYKTTICGVAVLVIAVLYNFKIIDQESVTFAISAVTALGFALSKDFNASHTKDDKDKPQ
jgi:hypothetical protein